MNKIEKKVSILGIKKSFFVHPSLDARDTLEAKFNSTLYGFEIDGVEYLIEDSYSLNPNNGFANSHNVFVQLSENQWGSASARLYKWEFDFLVNGHDLVNSRNYYADQSKSFGEGRFLTSKEFETELENWRKKDESGETENMVDYFKNLVVPVVLDENGEWNPKTD